jgi:hypothetical protein
LRLAQLLELKIVPQFQKSGITRVAESGGPKRGPRLVRLPGFAQALDELGHDFEIIGRQLNRFSQSSESFFHFAQTHGYESEVTQAARLFGIELERLFVVIVSADQVAVFIQVQGGRHQKMIAGAIRLLRDGCREMSPGFLEASLSEVDLGRAS